MTELTRPNGAMIAGFGFTGYRSFFGPMQVLGPLGKVNLIAGQNNSGKSNILRFLHEYLHPQEPRNPNNLDVPRVPQFHQFEFAIARHISSQDIDEAARRQNGVNPDFIGGIMRKLVDAPEIRLTNDSLAWFSYRVSTAAPQSSQLVLSTPDNILDALAAIPQDFSAAAQALFGQGHGQKWAVAALLDLFSPLKKVPPVRMIPAFRRITNDSSDDPLDAAATGRGLVRGLQTLQQPGIDRQEDKERFATINGFLQRVLGDTSAELDIPHDASMIHVRVGDLVLPLEHLGTGIHQVTVLAAAATLIENSLVCMEEPEVHLHPLLQRKLIRYLSENTSNQYFIATHSAHLLDHERATVFHVQLGKAGTEVQRAGTPQELADLCADLGYRPSDLLQANAVIWVEGPSDRIYLRHWISLMDPTLIEGVHYSIMFYGGRLLNHLTANDPEVDEFISLRRLNRHISILIDSDKTSAHKLINATKKRVRDEFERPEMPGLAWITDGRTIENYVPTDMLAAGLNDIYQNVSHNYDGDKWADPLSVSPSKRIDKVKLAQAVCARWPAERLDHRDLGKRMRDLLDFINTANGIPKS